LLAHNQYAELFRAGSPRKKKQLGFTLFNPTYNLVLFGKGSCSGFVVKYARVGANLDACGCLGDGTSFQRSLGRGLVA
jgi:hypothetical protein